MHKYFEKIIVLQNLQGTIIRVMIMHDGQRNYSIQRSNVINGVTKHFYNKKLWHSLYHVYLILERRIEDYEQKGYDIIEEFQLNINRINKPQFRFDNHKLTPGTQMTKISHDAIPVFIETNFHGVEITDMRYQSELKASELVGLFESITQDIHFIPFVFTGLYEPNTKRLTVIKIDYWSKPDPKALYTFEHLAKNQVTEIAVDRYENSIAGCDSSGTYALFENDIVTFHFAQWKALNLIVEQESVAGTTCKLYSMKNHRHSLIHTMDLQVKQNHQAMFLVCLAERQVNKIIYLSRTEQSKRVSETPFLDEVKAMNPQPISVEQLFEHFLPI